MRRPFLTAILVVLFFSPTMAQQVNTSHKGPRVFPGHLDIFISVGQDTTRYELFNHWYSWSYAELRQIAIPTTELENWNQNDSLRLVPLKSGNIKLKDLRYKLNRTVKHRNICASSETMRKISYAYDMSKMNGLGHLALYERTDLKLDENEFRKLILSNLDQIKKE